MRFTAPLCAAFFVVAAPRSLAQCEIISLEPAVPANGDAFGQSVAVDAGTLLVGSLESGNPASGGMATFFDGPSWAQTDSETPATFAADDAYGQDVDISGDYAVVGMPNWDSVSDASIGKVFVYERTGTLWSEMTQLLASDGAAEDRFGWSVAIDGDTLVVGARGDDDNGSNSGSAYVFEREPTGWVETSKLSPLGGLPDDLFGWSVDIDADTIVVGSSSDIAASNAGAVHVFGRTGPSWSETATLVASDPVANYFMGQQVSIDGDTILASLGFTQMSGLTTGAVYVFDKNGASWSQSAKIEHNVIDPGDRFGASHAISGDHVVIGAPSADNPGGNFNTGVAYSFRRIGGIWTQLAQYRPSNLGDVGVFGQSVDVDGDTVAIGAPGAFAPTFAGYAYIYQMPSYATPYGFCGSGSPCGNIDPVAGCASSAFEGAVIGACGSASVGADDLVITVSRLPINKWGIIYMGPAQISLSFGDGIRLIGAGGTGTFRFPPQFSGTARRFDYGPGNAAFSSANFPVAGHIAAGQTWNFQGWYRDPTGPCGGGFNLSNGVEVVFGP